MRRKTEASTAAPPEQIHVIEATGIYFTDTARRLLRLRASSLRREIREGRLQVCKRCGRHYFLGAQLLEWLRGGELRREKPVAGEPSSA